MEGEDLQIHIVHNKRDVVLVREDPQSTVAEPALTLSGHTDWVMCVAWSPDGKRLVTASRDKTAALWDAACGAKLLTLVGHTDYVSSIAWRADGGRLATGSMDTTCIVWDAVSGAQLATLAGRHKRWVSCIAWSPCGMDHLLSASWDPSLVVWDTTARTVLASRTKHTRALISAAWSPSGEYILSGGWDSTARVWAVRASEVEDVVFRGHTDCVTGVSWCPDGKRCVSSSTDKSVIVWDPCTGVTLLVLLQGLLGPERLSIAACNRKVSLVWRGRWTALASRPPSTDPLSCGMQPLAARRAPSTHTSRIIHVAWHPDGHRVAAASCDKHSSFVGPVQRCKASDVFWSHKQRVERQVVTVRALHSHGFLGRERGHMGRHHRHPAKETTRAQKVGKRCLLVRRRRVRRDV